MALPGNSWRVVFRDLIAMLWIAASSACAPDVDRPSVLLLTLDTTRADRLGAYGRDEAGTRSLDALAREGTLFEWAFTPVPITLPAHASILTGTYPNRHGIRDNGYRLGSELVTLAEVLQKAEYRTAAFVAAFPLYARFGLDRGFEVYDDGVPSLEGPRRIFPPRSAEEVVANAISWLATLRDGDPFFLWVHFFDPHASYLPPQPYAGWYASDLYQGEIAYMDEWIGKLLARLAELGRAENTLVVVVADHGEALGQHGERQHAELVYNSTMRVPLILRGSGIDAGRRVSAPVSTVDLLPTLLELVSLEAPEQLQGTSLAPLLRGASAPRKPIYLESFYSRLHQGWSELQGVVSEGWKYIEAPAAGGRGELYELVADPEELSDRIAERPELADRLRDELDVLRQQPTEVRPPSKPLQLADDERRELEALGYLTARAEPPGDGALHPGDMVAVTSTYKDALALIEAGLPGRSVSLIEKIERDYPGSLTAHKIRGRFLLESGIADRSLLPRALEELEAALALAPHSAEEQRYVAEVHFELGDWPTGLRYFARAVQTAPSMANLQLDYRSLLEEAAERARELERAGTRDEALALLDVLAELEPEDPAAARRAESLRRKMGRD